jgi:biopolymer transport protein ExbB/TolQ
MAAGVLALIHLGPLKDTVARRYVSHPVEYVEVVMFCGALGALGAKLFGSLGERRACGLTLMPRWDGKSLPLTEAPRLLAGLQQQPAWAQGSLIVRRASAVLEFLCKRGSADQLDDHLRTLSDNDVVAMEGSYALTRFITWAIPILGFLGTVLGITGAISGVTPEVLENSLSTVTDGLALAFDATALALGLTMVTMFLSFIVERAEQGVLDSVDRFADRELAHRFERSGTEGGEFVAVAKHQTQVLLQALEHVVQRQTALWSQALETTDVRRTEAEQQMHTRLSTAIERALEKTLETHTQRLASLEKQAAQENGKIVEQLGRLAGVVRDTAREQQTALAQITQGIGAQVEALTRLLEGDKNLRRLQETLNQNLTALAGAGAFDQALHSLTAAIHLLTARSGAAPAGGNRLGSRPGAAA